MSHLLIILAFATPHLAALLTPERTEPLAPAWLLRIAPWVGVVLGGVWAISQCERAVRRATTRGDMRSLTRAYRVTQHIPWGTLLVVQASWALFPTLTDAHPPWLVALERLASLAPVLASISLSQFAFATCEQRIDEAMLMRHLGAGQSVHPPVSRWVLTGERLRRHAGLVLVPIAFITLVDCSLSLVPMEQWESWATRAGASSPFSLREGVATALAIGLMLVLAPHVLAWLWALVPLSGPSGESARGVLRETRTRLRGPMLLRTRNAEANALVQGGLPISRYLILSDALVESLTPAQLDAVVAHEAAHVRLRHIPILAAGALAGGICGAWLAYGLASLLGRISALAHLAPQLTDPLATILSLLCGVLALGVVSRRVEWQADAFAVKHLSRVQLGAPAPLITPQSVHAMCEMLTTVALCNGLSPARRDWRHGSIEQRQERLRTLVGRAHNRLPIDRTVSALTVLSALVLVGGSIPWIVG